MSTGVNEMTSRSSKSGKKKVYRSTFTYYIPAPPHRKSGYREREFDKIMQGILTAGFEIEELQTQSVGGAENSGLYILALLRTDSKKTFSLDQGQEIHENFRLSDAPASSDIILEDENVD